MHKIAVLGPVAPFRGGIAQHTANVANALARIADVHVVSFSRLYPRWLYPGTCQTETTRITMPDAASIGFVLDSVNPITWRHCLSRLEQLNPHCVVIPWWTFFLGPCFAAIAGQLRAMNIPVLFLCHNVVDHEAALWKRELSRSVLRNGRWFIVHARTEKEKLERLLPDTAPVYHPQPLFDHFPPAQGVSRRRASLELLFYGFIRPYKGLEILIDAMTLTPELDVHLSIVGEPWRTDAAAWRQRIASAGIDRKVEFMPRYVTEQETAEYFHRADAIVLPYTSATGTAVAAAAYHYRKPVIASRVGGLVDIVDEESTGLLFAPGSAGALAGAIRSFAADGLPEAPSAIERFSSRMTWDGLAACVVDMIAQPERVKYTDAVMAEA